MPNEPTRPNIDDPGSDPGLDGTDLETTRRDLTERLDHLRAARLHATQPAPDQPANLRFLAPTDTDIIAPPTAEEIDALLNTERDDPDVETDTIDTLQSFWADERRLNANRIWHTIDDELDETPQTFGRMDGIRRRNIPQGSPLGRTLRHWRGLAAAAGVAAAMIISSVALPFHDGGRSAERTDGGRAVATGPRPDRPISVERVVQPDPNADPAVALAVTTLASQINDLSIFTQVALEDGTLSGDEQVSIEQRVSRIATTVTADDAVVEALGTHGVDSVVTALTNTSNQLARHNQPDDAPVAASAASVMSVAHAIEQSSAALAPETPVGDTFVAAVPAPTPAPANQGQSDNSARSDPQTLNDLIFFETTPGPAATTTATTSNGNSGNGNGNGHNNADTTTVTGTSTSAAASPVQTGVNETTSVAATPPTTPAPDATVADTTPPAANNGNTPPVAGNAADSANSNSAVVNDPVTTSDVTPDTTTTEPTVTEPTTTEPTVTEPTVTEPTADTSATDNATNGPSNNTNNAAAGNNATSGR